jgi:hypothetical protein
MWSIVVWSRVLNKNTLTYEVMKASSFFFKPSKENLKIILLDMWHDFVPKIMHKGLLFSIISSSFTDMEIDRTVSLLDQQDLLKIDK